LKTAEAYRLQYLQRENHAVTYYAHIIQTSNWRACKSVAKYGSCWRRLRTYMYSRPSTTIITCQHL